MDVRLIVPRVLPDGRISKVEPYHISLEGLEKGVICRDEEDYDQVVKYIFLSALRTNNLVVIYAVVSNHAHIALLSECVEAAERFSKELKRVIAMWHRKKYEEFHLLLGSETDVKRIETVQHARNVLAYIPRNAMDNGAANIQQYKWTGYRAMFCNGISRNKIKKVSSLSSREVERIFHTGSNLNMTNWLINESNELEPASACDWKYLESLFNNSQSFYLKLLGEANTAQIVYEQAVEGKRKLTDSEFMNVADYYAKHWYQLSLSEMTPTKKVSFLEYLGKKIPLTIPQVARCMKLERHTVAKVLGRLPQEPSSEKTDYGSR